MLDTNMISITPVNVLSSGTALHDMSCFIGIDPSGKFAYMGTAQSVVYPTVYNNVIMQLPIPTLSPTTYLTYDGLAFKEVGSITYVAPGTGRANGMNGMAASPNWLYVYDGSYLKERNKASGAEVDSVFVTNTSFQWGGLDVDACDNIYAGLKDSIYVYDVSLAVTNKIALTNTVFDVVLGQNDLLYACGKGFVTSMSVPAPSKLISTAAGTPTSCSACDGKATVTVNCGVAPFSYLWSNGSTGSVDSNLCAGIYTVTVTDGSCPPRQDTAIVNISGKSGYTATVTDTNPDCGIKKGNITIFPTGGTAPYSYNWSNGETNQKDTGIGAGTYTCVVTDNGGCKYTVVTTLINPTAPIVKISPTPDSVCLGSSTSLTASGAKTYVWNPGSLVGTTVIVSPLTTTTYTVSALDSNGCNGSATITVVVNPVPTVSIVPPSDSICSGSGVTITASGASTYTWTPATGLSCLSCANPLASPTVTTTYTVVGKNGHGCEDSSTVKIVVKPKPVPTITVIPTSDTICNGDSAMLIAGGGGAYDWTFSGSPNDTVWVKPASSTIYTLQVTLDGCVATINTKVIVVGAGIPKITVSKDSICQGDSTMLTATGGGTYKWLVAGNPTGSFIWVKPATNTTYSVVVTTPCGNDTAVTSKLVHVLPYPVISTSGNKTMCRGNNATISASGGSSYLWSPGGSTSSTVTVSPFSTTTYTVAVSNGLCLKDTTITVTVDTPAILTISPNQKICAGDSITLTATGGPSYKWSNGATTSSIKVGPNSTTTYTCVVNKNGCLDSTSTTVTVDVPVLNICCDKTIMPGGSDTIGATAGFLSYVWAPNNNISCITVSCDTIIATPSVTTTYVVTAKDAAGCTISRQVTVFVEIPCADFTVPNIFTPNNDGRNDDFVINILNPSTYSIVIYDRWGKEVYTSTDPTVYWNGKVMGTQYLVSDGIYYYIIKATCGSNDYVKKGFVQVVGEQ